MLIGILTAMFVFLFVFLNNSMFVLSGADEEKCSLRFMKFKCDIEKNHTIKNCNNHSKSTVCKKEFTISLVSYSPHDYGLYSKLSLVSILNEFKKIFFWFRSKTFLSLFCFFNSKMKYYLK